MTDEVADTPWSERTVPRLEAAYRAGRSCLAGTGLRLDVVEVRWTEHTGKWGCLVAMIVWLAARLGLARFLPATGVQVTVRITEGRNGGVQISREICTPRLRPASWR